MCWVETSVRLNSIKMASGSIWGLLLFLVCVNDMWRNIDSSSRLLAYNCIVCRKITNKSDIENLQNDLDTLGEWAIENRMIVSPSKWKATIRYMGARVKIPRVYSLCDKKNSGSKQLWILGNNLTKRFKLGGPSKLHSAKSLEGASLCNACSQKRK